MVPPPVPLVDYIARHHSVGVIPSPHRSTGVIPSPHRSTGIIRTFHGESITRTYTMALDDPETSISSTLLDISMSPGMG
jgi:hypothetical protein